jgi:hypothetical protein
MSRKRILSVGGGAIAFLLFGGATGIYLGNPLGNNLEVYPVKLTTDTNTDGKKIVSVDVDDNNKKCKKDNHPGCLLFGQDKVGAINFYLKGSKRNTEKCKKDDATPKRKVITKIELTTQEHGDDPDKGIFDGDSGWATPDKWLKENAFPSVDLTTGIAYEIKPADIEEMARTRVFLTNMNDHDAKEGTKTFWYKITVSQCDGKDGPWVSDPRGDNKGTNY